MERPPFNPGRLDPCFCRSGKRFKNCCGSRAPDREPPFSVHLVPGFVPVEECREIVGWADTVDGERLGVVDDTEQDATKDRRRESALRVTEKVPLGERADVLNGWVRRAVDEHIVPTFRREMEWFEAAELMRYTPGGWFTMHADSEHFDSKRNVWKKVVDRDVSLLIYLNSDFEGGELSFPVFNWTYRPRPGDLIFFPSDSRFQHEARTVDSGRRYAVVSWMVAKNAPRVHNGHPEGAIFL